MKQIIKTSDSLPRISVNKLAEYLDSNSSRRKKIIEDAKNPENFIVTRYDNARKIIIKYLKSGCDIVIIHNGIEELKKLQTSTNFQKQDKELSILSLKELEKIDLRSLRKFEILLPKRIDKKTLKINGVSISVNPDLIIYLKNESNTKVGGIKLHIKKNKGLTENSQEVVSLLLQKHIENFILEKNEKADRKMCLSLDIFNNKFIQCPVSSKSRYKQIEAACEEIALRWEKL